MRRFRFGRARRQRRADQARSRQRGRLDAAGALLPRSRAAERRERRPRVGVAVESSEQPRAEPSPGSDSPRVARGARRGTRAGPPAEVTGEESARRRSGRVTHRLSRGTCTRATRICARLAVVDSAGGARPRHRSSRSLPRLLALEMMRATDVTIHGEVEGDELLRAL